MLEPKEAAKRLSSHHIRDWRDQQQKRISGLGKTHRSIATWILDDHQRARTLEECHQNRQALLTAGKALDSLDEGKRLAIFEACWPQIAVHVENAWQLQKSMPYQRGYGFKAFRAPRHGAASIEARIAWLQLMNYGVGPYHQDVEWLATWASPISGVVYCMGALGVLFAAAIDAGGEEGQKVYDILLASGRGEHEISGMGQHVIAGLLGCSKPEAWEFIGKMLLAAQRQEGLRQAILESADVAHMGAFRHILRLILNENLARFSATARAVLVWFSVIDEALNSKTITSLIDLALRYLEDPQARREALNGTRAREVYMALWAHAFEDAFEAIEQAKALLKHRDVTIRFTATHVLGQLGLIRSISEARAALNDEDLRPASLAVALLADGSYSATTGEDVFAPLQAVYSRFPEKEQTLESPLWTWQKITAARGQVVDAMAANLGKRSPTQMLPYLQEMSSRKRQDLAESLCENAAQLPKMHTMLLALAGDPSPRVREPALDGLKHCHVNEKEAAELEPLLARKAGDLRRGVLTVLLTQKDSAVLASADRLMKASKSPLRAGGIELLRQMVDTKRAKKTCVEKARAFVKQTPEFSEEEQRLLNQILQGDQELPTLENALGMVDLGRRTKARPVTKPDLPIVTPAAEACIKSLDDLIHAHRETVVKLRNGKEDLLSNAGYGFPSPSADTSTEEDLPNLPIAEVWQTWLNERPAALRDPDGLELIRAFGLSFAPPAAPVFTSNWVDKTSEPVCGAFIIRRCRYKWILQNVLEWMVKLNPVAREADLLLAALETAFGLTPPNEIQRWLRSWESPCLVWQVPLQWHRQHCPQRWQESHHRQWWRLLKWLDEPISPQGAPLLTEATLQKEKEEYSKRHAYFPDYMEIRRRPDTLDLLAAFELKEASEVDVVDHLIGPRGDRHWRYSFRSLSELTQRNQRKSLSERPLLRSLVDRVRQRILEVELTRGDTPTAASPCALNLSSVWGVETVVQLLKAIGKEGLVRTGDTLSKTAVFSHLIRVSFPDETDTPETFKSQIERAGIDSKQLIALATFAPQWARMVEHAVGKPGIEEAIWWFHAHTKDRQWSVEEDVRTAWAAEISARTEVAPEDLLDGAVDVKWFRSAYQQAGATTWSQIASVAKYASRGSGHKRAQVFSDALLGEVGQAQLTAKIEHTRDQDSVRALGLIPLPDGQAGEKDLLQRFKTIQEFIRSSRQFGSQRQASEKRAAAIGQENLARTAGYRDPIRLQWAMEARAIADLADGPIKAAVGNVEVALSINDFGEIDFSVSRDGKQLKTPPPSVRSDPQVKALRQRKTELVKQASRIRFTLEQMMCRGDILEGIELAELMRHLFIGPTLSRLILTGEGIIGYPRNGGAVLEDWQGRREPVKRNEKLRIVHPHDLLKTGQWHEWQRECIKAERVQPFKQVFRELYVLTSTERTDLEVSHRYAGHQIQPRQALALLGTRGWVLAPEEGIRRTFHDEGLSAWVVFEQSFCTPAEVEGLTLEGITYTRRSDGEAIPLDRIPPRVFSEVMRDLDLVVSVAHLGGVDPEATASTIEMRSDLLRELLAVLNMDNVHIQEEHVVVSGSLGKYSVHLGSAVTHLIPGGQLLIVPVHAQHRGRLFLPFADDDPRTAEVVSKVLLLARDTDIRDPSILAQIRILS